MIRSEKHQNVSSSHLQLSNNVLLGFAFFCCFLVVFRSSFAMCLFIDAGRYFSSILESFGINEHVFRFVFLTLILNDCWSPFLSDFGPEIVPKCRTVPRTSLFHMFSILSRNLVLGTNFRRILDGFSANVEQLRCAKAD